MEDHRDRNVVAAVCLRFAGELEDAVAELTPRSEPAQAIAFIGREPSLTIRHLSNLLSLSHAATVRLINRMFADGLVARGPSEDDGRAVALDLTPLGQQRYSEMLSAQAELADRTLSALSNEDQKTFVHLCRKILSSRARSPDDAARGCRFCDVDACQDCPVQVEA